MSMAQCEAIQLLLSPNSASQLPKELLLIGFLFG